MTLALRIAPAMAAVLVTAGATHALSQDVTRRELMRRVDRKVLAEKHHLDVRAEALSRMELRMLLSIDAVTPSAPTAGDRLQVTYTLTNLTLQRTQGTATGSFQGRSLVAADGSPPTAVDLAPGQSLTADLVTASATHEGNDPVTIGYRDRVTCRTRPDPHGGSIEVCVAAVTADATARVAVTANPVAVDTDGDGIPDARESLLLARFRPFYRFSKSGGDDEDNRPADALWFVSHSELQDHHSETDTPVVAKETLAGDPSRLLDAASIGPSFLGAAPGETEYYLNLSNESRPDTPGWDRIVAEATGLYGHVSPLREKPANPSEITAYKIEYWQFYAFNPVPGQVECWIVAGPAKGSDAHEGDWEGIELVIDANPNLTIRRVRHNVHSTDVVFELRDLTAVSMGGGFVEYGGGGVPDSFDLYVNRDSDARHNQRVRFFCNEDGCTHPVTYIEHGGHASWPTEHWFWPGVLNHDGDSPHAYLVATPVNLGEVGRPTPGCAACALVVGFNGHWGACGGDPPHGPPLHGSWGKP